MHRFLLAGIAFAVILPLPAAAPPVGQVVHWAFRTPVRPAVPRPAHAGCNPIDSFLLSRLERAGLAPAPPADRRTLLRRVTFDLIGLPPTPAEIDAFLNDRARAPTTASWTVCWRRRTTASGGRSTGWT